ncbi:MAG: hypothetical protein QG621_441 [Patescibacteria group bacterium]|nr:hypothetical protein [Patescibacteria group bacterium]
MHISTKLLVTAVFAVSFLPVSVFAAPAVETTAASSTQPAKLTAAQQAKLKTAIEKADKEIDRRVVVLTELNTRVQAMERVTPDFKNTLSANVQTQITALGQLKTKIDADTDLETLKSDVKAITDSYRIFALVLPQTRIAVAADREVTLIAMMNSLGTKLQARLQELQSQGKDVGPLLTALTDMSSKLKDAATQAQAAVSVTATLTPDAGDKAKMESNTTALKTGRSDIQAAQKDLVAARKDAKIIIDGLKALGASVGSASSTQATVTPAR